MRAIDLNRLHHALHQVTGDMAIKFNRATPADLELWIRTLRVIAGGALRCLGAKLGLDVRGRRCGYNRL